MKSRRRGQKTRRSKRKHNIVNNQVLNKWTIFHSNIRGYLSKKASLDNIALALAPNLICLNEHGLRGTKKPQIKGYKSFTRNRVSQSMGGVSISVKGCEYKDTVKIKEGLDNDEFLITRHSQFIIPINVISLYGEQESRCSTQEIEERWARIVAEIGKIESRNEYVVLLGDLNKHVGSDEEGIKGNIDKISFGGELLRKFLSQSNYIMLNKLPLTKGGPFTRVDPSNPTKRSCLDYAIVSTALLPYIEDMIIDSDRTITPKRVGVKGKDVSTNHYSFIINFKNLPLANRSKKKEEVIIWNTNKTG